MHSRQVIGGSVMELLVSTFIILVILFLVYMFVAVLKSDV